jgi:mono/diheme cytochrome c family protein
MAVTTRLRTVRAAFATLLLTAVAHATAAEAQMAPASVDSTPPRSTDDGAALYAEHCAICHGVYGEGDGVIAPSLAVVLQDLRYLTARNNGEFPRDFIIGIIDGRAVRAAHGPEGMPVWGAEFARDQPFDERAEQRVNASIDALTDFLESIQIDSNRDPAAPR